MIVCPKSVDTEFAGTTHSHFNSSVFIPVVRNQIRSQCRTAGISDDNEKQGRLPVSGAMKLGAHMKKLSYSISIDAHRTHIWNTILAPGKYEQWVKAFSDNSSFAGKWGQGETVRFVDPNLGGTKAIVEIFEPHDCIVVKHVAMIAEDGREETDSDIAKQWIGTIEKYVFAEHNGQTTLTIEMDTHQAFVDMFDACWPKALEKIKIISEDEGGEAA